MSWSKADRNFIKELNKAKTKEDISKVVSKYFNSNSKPSQAYHNAILSLFKVKTSDAEALEALKVAFKGYVIMYPVISTIRAKLSQVRTKSIKGNQSANVFKLSKYDEYFNISEEKRMGFANKYKSQITGKNENKIQVDVKEVMAKMTTLILSDNVYDKLIALMLSVGTRSIEIFDRNEFELIPDKPSWIRVNHLAKKRDPREKNWTERPVIEFTPKFVKDTIQTIRNGFKAKGLVIINDSGELAKNQASALNKRVLEHFPWLSKVHQKSSFLRKIYSDLAFKNYADKSTTNFNTFVSSILGHGDLLSSFSYSYVNVSNPNCVQADEFQTQLEELRGKLNLLLKGGLDSKGKEIEATPERKVGRRASKEEKLALLEEIWKTNPKITNSQMRKQSRIGSKLVNTFLAGKKE
jgi:hypothetical protein